MYFQKTLKSSLLFYPFLKVSEPLSFRNTERKGIKSSKNVAQFFPWVIYDNAAKAQEYLKAYLTKETSIKDVLKI